MQEPYLRSGTSVRAETSGLFSTQMYVSSVEKSAKSVRSIEEGTAGTDRSLRAMPSIRRSAKTGFRMNSLSGFNVGTSAIRS